MNSIRSLISTRTSGRSVSLVKDAFIRDEIVPDIIQTPPKAVLEVEFNNGKIVTLGNKIMPLEAKDQPRVRWEADDKKYYFLININPDMPTRALPWLGEFHNWMVVNIPGNKVEFGETRYPYIPPAPPKGIYQRYVYLVFAQPSYLDFKIPQLRATASKARLNYCIGGIVTEYGLGEPVAGNFFESTWDPYVPMIRKKIGYNL